VAGVVLLACGLGVLIAVVFGGLGAEFTAMGHGGAPLVEESTGLYFSVNDMDAQVANVLLTGNSPVLAASQRQDLAIYAADMQRAEQDLQKLAVAAADPATQRTVGSVLDTLGRYEALAAAAIVVNKRGGDPAGRPSAATLSYYRQATDLMRTGVLPAAASLTSSNANSLDTAYDRSQSAALSARPFVVILGLFVVGVLACLQVYLAMRYRRLLNPALVTSTLLASGLTIAGVVQLGVQADRLGVAKQDAFDSILALTQARAVSYDANADESRYLVDPGRAAQYEGSFLAKSQQIADMGSFGIGGYDSALASYIGVFESGNGDVSLDGYLGVGFSTTAFPGERAAAIRALRAYQVYEQDDQQLRAMAAVHLDQAIAFDIGTNPGQSDWAFNNWDTALTAAITIDGNAFTAAIKDGEHTCADWTWIIPAAAAAAIVALTIAGTWRRLTEYR
jgi:hypothetical protein